MRTIENTIFVGKVLHHFPALGSTNSYAMELASKSNPSEGTLIITDDQSAGQGQYGSQWHSSAGKNLTLSLILRPNFLLARQQFLLSQAIALSVHDFLKLQIDQNVWIKWPNDIWIGDRKIAGILIQNIVAGRNLNRSVVGLGININETDFPKELPNPTSLTIETQKTFDLYQLLTTLCQCLENWYLKLKANQIQVIRDEYQKRLLGYLQERTFQRRNGDLFVGKIMGFEDNGRIIIDSQKGREVFDLKEVKFIHDTV